MRFSDWSSDVCSSDLSSAGLNLGFDRYRYSFVGRDWGDATSPVRIAAEWTGPTPLDASLEIAGRQGCDVNPLDPSATADRERLLSYVRPDQPERLARIAEIGRALGRERVWHVVLPLVVVVLLNNKETHHTYEPPHTPQ